MPRIIFSFVSAFRRFPDKRHVLRVHSVELRHRSAPGLIRVTNERVKHRYSGSESDLHVHKISRQIGKLELSSVSPVLGLSYFTSQPRYRYDLTFPRSFPLNDGIVEGYSLTSYC